MGSVLLVCSSEMQLQTWPLSALVWDPSAQISMKRELTSLPPPPPPVKEPTIRWTDLNCDCGELKPNYLKLSLAT